MENKGLENECVENDGIKYFINSSVVAMYFMCFTEVENFVMYISQPIATIKCSFMDARWPL